jgi:hypothetical protein
VTLCDEVLATWRQAERVLETVVPGSSDEDDLRLAILTMRDLYQQVTRDQAPRLHAALAGATVERARILLAEIQARAAIPGS